MSEPLHIKAIRLPVDDEDQRFGYLMFYHITKSLDCYVHLGDDVVPRWDAHERSFEHTLSMISAVSRQRSSVEELAVQWLHCIRERADTDAMHYLTEERNLREQLLDYKSLRKMFMREAGVVLQSLSQREWDAELAAMLPVDRGEERHSVFLKQLFNDYAYTALEQATPPSFADALRSVIDKVKGTDGTAQ